jgi:hypothetical protein
MFNSITMGAISTVGTTPGTRPSFTLATTHFWFAVPANTNFAATADYSKYGKCGTWDSIG